MAKKVGIVTIHTTFNYGAVLQAYATETFFNNNGYDAELINYTNQHIQQQLKLSYKQNGRMRGYVITFIRNTLFGRLGYYRKMIKSVDENTRISSRTYRTVEELNHADYDILVAGSDQLWSPQITKTFDPVFFLQFGKAEKRISVASSFGSYRLKEADKEIIKTYLERFDAISVREQFAKEQIDNLVQTPVSVVMDPTFLLDRQQWWQLLASKSPYAKPSQKYIVTYFAGGNKHTYRKTIAQYAEKFQLPVWTIQYSNYTWPESDKKILGASIEDFMALIANAELVITDSFHGTAISLNMGTNFVSLTNKENPVRVRDLLEKLNLSERLDMDVSQYREVDYSQVSPIIERCRRQTQDWILQAAQ